MRAAVRWLVALALAASACSAPAGPAGPVERFRDLAAATITLRIVDETGNVVPTANLSIEGRGIAASGQGTITYVADQPALGMVTAPDHVTMPIVLTPEMEPTQTVRLLARLAGDGTPRIVLNFAGDTMMGRRYQEPTRPGTPVVSTLDEDAARAVVADVAPLFAAADLSSLNLESVVGTLPATVPTRGNDSCSSHPRP